MQLSPVVDPSCSLVSIQTPSWSANRGAADSLPPLPPDEVASASSAIDSSQATTLATLNNMQAS